MVAAQAQYAPLTTADCVNGLACILGHYRDKNIILDSEMYTPFLDYAYMKTISRNAEHFIFENMNALPMDIVDCDALYRKPEKPSSVARSAPMHNYSKSITMTEMSERCCVTYLDLETLLGKFIDYLDAIIAGAVLTINREFLRAISAPIHVIDKSQCDPCKNQSIVSAADDRVEVVDATGAGGFTYEKYLEVMNKLSKSSLSGDVLFVGPFRMWNDLRLDLQKTGNLGCECRDDAGQVKTINGHSFFVPSAPGALFRVENDPTLSKNVVYGYAISRGALAFAHSPSVMPGFNVYFDQLHPAIRSTLRQLFGNPDTLQFAGGNIPVNARSMVRNMLDITIEVNPAHMFKGLIGSVETRFSIMRTFPGGIVKIALPDTYLN